MGRGPELHPAKRQDIITKRECGLPWKQIAEMTGVSVDTCRFTYRARLQRGERQETLARPGRPSKLSQNQVERAKRVIRRSPKSSLQEISANLQVHPRTFARNLRKNDSNIIHTPCRSRPYLTDAAVHKRLEYAEDHLDDTQEQWEEAWWTDECAIRIGEGAEQEWVWRTDGEASDHDKLQHKARPGATLML